MLSLHSNLGSDGKRKNPSQRLDELMQKAKGLLNKGAKKKRAESTVRFFYDSVTGRRITHCKYQPRSKVHVQGEEGAVQDVDMDIDEASGIIR